MTTSTLPNPPPRPPDGVNWPRMLKVWGILAASMTAAALAGWAAMPRGGETPTTIDPLPDASALEALVWPATLPSGVAWKYIVIHHSATPAATPEAIRQYHEGLGFEGIGYHFIINNGRASGTRDGEITPTQRWYEQRPGAHARVLDHPEFNTDGIGVCLVGNLEAAPPTALQMASLELLVRALRRRYGIGLDAVVGHGELKNTRCPGRYFPMEAFLMALREAAIRERLAPAPGAPAAAGGSP